MYKLELDLHLKFVPPMSEHGQGIVLTRTVELPFPPQNDLCLVSREFDDCPDPMGFCLKDVKWDLDRRVFLARTTIAAMEEPLAFIADSIRGWIRRGWRLGSYEDSYSEEPGETLPDYEPDEGREHEEYTALEMLQTLPTNRRPRAFNRMFKALIRHMAETHNNDQVAYAMDTLGRCVDPSMVETVDGMKGDPLVDAWRSARFEFSKMSAEEKSAWRQRTEKYPTIEAALREG